MHPQFTVHMLNAQGKERAKALATWFDELLTLVEGLVPEGRELSIVRTKLEEASFFAKKGMAINPENQENTSGS